MTDSDGSERDIQSVGDDKKSRRKGWERQQHEDYMKIVTALNSVADELKTTEEEANATERKKGRREVLTIFLVFVTVVLTFLTLKDSRDSTAQAKLQSEAAISESQWASSVALDGAHIDSYNAIAAANTAASEQAAQTRQALLIDRESAEAATKQLALAEDAQRAWLTITPRIIGQVSFENYFDGVVWTPLNFTIENVGHRPAFHISVSQWTVPLSPNIKNIQESRCRELKAPIVAQQGYGRVLFPNKTIEDWNKDATGTATVFGFSKKTDFLKASNGGNRVQIWVIGCVSYDFGDEHQRHSTGFIYRIGHLVDAPIPGGKALDVSFSWGEQIPEDRLILDSGWSINSLMD